MSKPYGINKIGNPRSTVISILSPLYQETTLQRLALLVDRLRSQGPLYHPAVLDLACLFRALRQLQSVTKEQICHGQLLSRSIEQITLLKRGLELLIRATESKTVDEASFVYWLQQTLFATARLLSMTR